MRPIYSLISLALLIGTLAIGPASSAGAAPSEFKANVDIAATSASPRSSGSPFTYDIDFSCDFLGDAVPPGATGCENVDITIPLGDLATLPGLGLSLAASPLVESWERVGDSLVIRMVSPVPPGESVRLQLTVTPPNQVTPNNTSWSLLPVVTGSNVDPAPAPTSAVGQATATLKHTISKKLQGSAFRDPGDTVVYDVVVSCSVTSTGMITANTMTVTDSIPGGLTFVSSTPPTTPVGDQLTWQLSAADGSLPTTCSAGGNGTASFKVTATVDDDVAYGTAITNTATVASTTIDGQQIQPVSGKASITIVGDDTELPGTFKKDSFGQLRDRNASPSNSGAGLEQNSHTTYPGNWAGFLNPQQNNVLRSFTPNQNTSMMQSGYKMQYVAPAEQGAGYEIRVVDPMPCLDNKTGQVYSSEAPGTLCQNPAFHVTTVAVSSSRSGDVPELPASYAPLVRYADGTTAPMVRTGGANPADTNYAQFTIPDLSRTDIAEIEFPRSVGLSGPTVRWGVFGYVDAGAQSGEIAKNISEFTTYYRSGTNPRQTGRDDADLYIEDFPQVGIDKRLGAHNAEGPNRSRLSLDGRLFVSGEASEDFIVTDLLPAGMTVVQPVPAATVTATNDAANGTQQATNLTAQSEVINNFQGTGRQLLRFTVKKADLAPLGAARVTLSSRTIVTYVNEPGTYNNTAQTFYNSDALATSCQQDPAYQQIVGDPLDLDGNNSTTDRFCEGRASLTVPPPTGGASYKVAKTVQGAGDPAPKAYPGVGLVGTDGGPVTFGLSWKNTGGTPLKNAVIYDILPAVGDRGVGGTVAGQPRNSQFTPTFVGIGPVPTGVTVAYSTSTNPCRPEVFANADNPGCVADWTTTQPADPATIAAIRLISSQTYQSGQGFSFDLKMTTEPVEDGKLAWNSIAGHATTAAGSPLRPTSPPKVGITATEEGIPLFISKELDDSIDPKNVNVGDTVTYRLTVANAAQSTRTFNGADVLPAGLTFASVTPTGDAPSQGVGLVPNSNPQTIALNDIDVPSGASLTWVVKATVNPGAVGSLTNRFGGENSVPITPPCEEDPEQTCVTVVVPPGALKVTKAVTGEGASFANGPFPVKVTCRIDDAVVFSNEFTLNGAEGKTLEAPKGSSCTVEETDSKGASNVSYLPGDTVTVPADGAAVTVAVTNRFDAGSLVVRKQVAGAGAALEDQTFSFDVACTFGDAEVLGRSVDVSIAAGATAASSDLLGPLPIGSTCVVAETDSAGADTTPDPVTVEIVANADDNTVSASFVNRYSAGTISVSKALEGDWAQTGAEDETVFTVQVACQLGDETVWSGALEVKGGKTVTAVDGDDHPILLPLGTVCTAEETNTGGATDVTISPANGVTVRPGDPDTLQALKIDVTNRFDAGSLTVAKSVSGVGAGLNSGDFAFDVQCTFDGRDVYNDRVEVVVGDDERTGRSAPISPLPIGADCTVTEVDAAGADEVADPVTVTIGDSEGGVETVELDNAFSAGTISVSKLVAGGWADSGGEDNTIFEIQVTCALGDKVVYDQPVQFAAGTSDTITDDEGYDLLLPVGTRCIGEEIDAKGATSKVVFPSSFDEAVVVEAGSPDELQELTITAINTFEAGALQVRKTLTGVGAQVAVGPVEFDVACTFEDRTVLERSLSLEIEPGQTELASEVIEPLPTGSECTVTETNAGNADEIAEPVTVTITGLDPTEDTPTEINLADVTNTYSAGTLAVTKKLDGKYADDPLVTDRTFELSVSCGPEDDPASGSVLDLSITLAGGQIQTLGDSNGDPLLIPAGTACFVTETDGNGASNTTIDHGTPDAAVVVASGQPEDLQTIELAVTNTFDKNPNPERPVGPDKPAKPVDDPDGGESSVTKVLGQRIDKSDPDSPIDSGTSSGTATRGDKGESETALAKDMESASDRAPVTAVNVTAVAPAAQTGAAGPLARTGTSVAALALIGLLLVAGGAALTVRRRRKTA